MSVHDRERERERGYGATMGRERRCANSSEEMESMDGSYVEEEEEIEVWSGCGAVV